MFFGRRPNAIKNWGDMYFYEKLQHVVDTTSDYIISKCRWWLPSILVSIATSVFLFGGPEALSQGVSLASVAVQPHLSPISFSAPPDAPKEMPEDDEDF